MEKRYYHGVLDEKASSLEPQGAATAIGIETGNKLSGVENTMSETDDRYTFTSRMWSIKRECFKTPGEYGGQYPRPTKMKTQSWNYEDFKQSKQREWVEREESKQRPRSR